MSDALTDKQPLTFDAAVKALHTFFMDQAKQEIRAALSIRGITAAVHHGLGRSLRNDWNLWAGGPLRDDMERLGFMHPDDMSGAILKRFACEVRGETYDLEADVARYRTHWKQYDPELVAEFYKKYPPIQTYNGLQISVGGTVIGKIVKWEPSQLDLPDDIVTLEPRGDVPMELTVTREISGDIPMTAMHPPETVRELLDRFGVAPKGLTEEVLDSVCWIESMQGMTSSEGVTVEQDMTYKLQVAGFDEVED